MMKIITVIVITILILPSQSYSQTGEAVLEGVISVWNDRASTPILLMDDFFYGLCEGDKIQVEITGSANLAPRDEERRGGGFLGLFKKRYMVRIDDWIDATGASFYCYINDSTSKSIGAASPKIFDMDIPFSGDGRNLANVMRIKAFVNQQMTPLRAGQYSIKLTVNSRERIDLLRDHLTSLADVPTVSFAHVKVFLEAGKLIHRYPDEVVDAVSVAFRTTPNLPLIEKEMYQYLLSFSPNNTTVRKKLADSYLKEFNFSAALENAKQVVDQIYGKYPGPDPTTSFTVQDKADLGSAYATLGAVDEQKELGLNENAYTKASFFFGLSAKWYFECGSIDGYAESVSKQARCLQKINDVESLKSAATILEKKISDLAGGGQR